MGVVVCYPATLSYPPNPQLLPQRRHRTVMVSRRQPTTQPELRLRHSTSLARRMPHQHTPDTPPPNPTPRRRVNPFTSTDDLDTNHPKECHKKPRYWLHQEIRSIAGVSASDSTQTSFICFPLAEQHQTIDRQDRNIPRGKPMRCLCGLTYPRDPDSDLKKTLWLTCTECWDQACTTARLRPQQ